MYVKRMDKHTKLYRIGYARVSTDDQDLSLQLDALTRAQCDRIFSEQVSAGKTHRPQLEECLRALRPGDVLTVWRLDRLGRSVVELITLMQDLQTRGIAFCSLTEAIDTTTAAGTLFFSICSAFAEFERNLISERTRAGLAAARARGRLGGRPEKLSSQDKAELKALYDSKKFTVAEICRRAAISRSTFYETVLGRKFRKK